LPKQSGCARTIKPARQQTRPRVLQDNCNAGGRPSHAPLGSSDVAELHVGQLNLLECPLHVPTRKRPVAMLGIWPLQASPVHRSAALIAYSGQRPRLVPKHSSPSGR
jgi:hypothetical protein